MSIVLSWNKKDADAVLNGYEIYRSTVKASLYQEVNRIAVINDKAQVQYTDATTVYDTPYWYGVRSKTIYGDVDSTALMLVEVTNSGYGAVAPVVGDYEDGFVASYPNEISFTSAANKIINTELLKHYTQANINTTIGPIAGGLVPNGGYVLNKFWKNGRMIFAPNHPTGGIAYNNLPHTDFYNKIIAPLLAAKPQVEIEGVMYEFRIMTRDEMLKYIACSSSAAFNHASNLYTDRVVPYSYYQTGSSLLARLFHQDTGTSIVGTQVSLSGAITDMLLGGTASNTTVGIAWYFTPVVN